MIGACRVRRRAARAARLGPLRRVVDVYGRGSELFERLECGHEGLHVPHSGTVVAALYRRCGACMSDQAGER